MNTERSFDDLLDDFLKMELEKEMNGSADNMVGQPLCEIMSDLVPYTSNGTIYYVPAACDPQYYFNRLTICFKNEELASDGEQKSLVLKDKIIGENQLLMQLEDIFLKYEGLSKTNEVSLYLYRVGKSEPVKVCERWISESIDSISYDSITGDFSEIEGGWIPGEYFVLVQNAVCTEDASESNWDTFHSHMRYSFRVVPSGHSLTHPSIKRVSLSSDKCLEVILDGKTGKLDDFRFLMYNEDWVADTKENMDEIANNICGAEHKRFINECKAAKAAGCDLYILVENDLGISKLSEVHRWENPRSAYSPKCVQGDRLQKAMETIQERYGVTFLFCAPKESAGIIRELIMKYG